MLPCSPITFVFTKADSVPISPFNLPVMKKEVVNVNLRRTHFLHAFSTALFSFCSKKSWAPGWIIVTLTHYNENSLVIGVWLETRMPSLSKNHKRDKLLSLIFWAQHFARTSGFACSFTLYSMSLAKIARCIDSRFRLLYRIISLFGSVPWVFKNLKSQKWATIINTALNRSHDFPAFITAPLLV